MEVRITSRHTMLPEPLRARTEELLSKLNKYGVRISVVEVVFDEEKNSKKIEAILHIDRSAPIVATGEGDEFSEALRQVNERLVRQGSEASRADEGPPRSTADRSALTGVDPI